MSDEVLFEDDANNRVPNIGITYGAPTGMLAWLIKNKVVKDGKQGERFLLVVTVVSAVLAIGIFLFSGKHTGQLTSEQQQQLQLMVNEMKSSQHP